MRPFRIAAISLAVLVLAAAVARAESAAKQSFDQVKTLAGVWEGKNSTGEPLKVSFRLTAGGSALMSEIEGHGEDMISMFHLDNDRLILTHYCTAGNQPRMVASLSPDGKSIRFSFLDATNLASPNDGHMDHVLFTMADADHHTEDWVFVKDGKEMHERFDLQRAK